MTHKPMHLVQQRQNCIQGGHKVGEKNSEFPRLFQSHNYTFPEVITTKRIRNNDLHISRVIPHQLLLMWLLSSHIAQINSFHAPDTLGCIWIAWHRPHLKCKVSFPRGCTEFPENSMSSPSSEKLWVFQVYQVCGHRYVMPTKLPSLLCCTKYK